MKTQSEIKPKTFAARFARTFDRDAQLNPDGSLNVEESANWNADPRNTNDGFPPKNVVDTFIYGGMSAAKGVARRASAILDIWS